MLNIQKSSLILILIIVVLIAGFVSLVTLGYTPGSVWHKAEDIKPGEVGKSVGATATSTYLFPNLEAKSQVTAGTTFHVGSSDLSSSELKVNNNSLVVTTTGNVGIGTTNPGAKLDVSGNVNVSGNIVAARPTTADQLATKGYVDEVVATIAMPQPQYSSCYLASASGSVTCESGYTKIVSADAVPGSAGGTCSYSPQLLVDSAPMMHAFFSIDGMRCRWDYSFWYDMSSENDHWEILKLQCDLIPEQSVRSQCTVQHTYLPSDVAMCCK